MCTILLPHTISILADIGHQQWEYIGGLVQEWSYVFVALTHRYPDRYQWAFQVVSAGAKFPVFIYGAGDKELWKLSDWIAWEN